MKARHDVLAELGELSAALSTLLGRARKLTDLDRDIENAEAEYKKIAAELNKARRYKEQIDSELENIRKRFRGELNI
jgi:DNA repair ATPase RecN